MLFKDKRDASHNAPVHRQESQDPQGKQAEQAAQRKPAQAEAAAAPTANGIPSWRARIDEMAAKYARETRPLSHWTRAVMRPDLYQIPSPEPESAQGSAESRPVQQKPEEPVHGQPAPAPARLGPDYEDAGSPAGLEAAQAGGDAGAVVDAVEQALSRGNPIAGVGDYPEAWRLLGGLGMGELLRALAELRARGRMELLYADRGALSDELAARLDAAQKALDVEALPSGQAAPGLLVPLADAVEALPSVEDKTAIYRYLFAKRQHWMDLDRLLEGATAMHNADVHARGEMLPQAVMGALGKAPAPIEPSPWTKPPDQPGSLYIGNEAHKGIAGQYRNAHRGEAVFINNVKVTKILERAADYGHSLNPGALSADEHARMPDILNLSKLYLYEIKPEAYAAEGKAKLALYLGIFGKAGLALSPGPSQDAGTSGALPAPDGVYIFHSPEPGLITYAYRKGRLVPVPVPQAEGQPNEAASKWRWELEPLTPEQQAMVATTMGMAMLILLMILLAPVGA